MSKVYLKDFYDCNKIDLSCELLYVCELGKYIYFNIENKELSLKGITFDKVLMESNIWFYFCLAIDEQWIVDVEVDKEWLIDLSSLTQKEWKEMSLVLNNVIFTENEIAPDYEDLVARKNSYEYDLRTPRVQRIGFTDIYPNGWHKFDLSSNNRTIYLLNSGSINSVLPQYSWVSLVAYAAMRNYLDKLCKKEVTFKLVIEFNDDCIVNEKALSFIMILVDKNKCVSRDWLKIVFDNARISEEQKRHIEYVAWYVEGEEKGLLARNEWYNGLQKRERLDFLDIHKGSVIFIFERPEMQKYNYIKTLCDCKIAIVRNITDKGIEVDISNHTTLKNTGEYLFKSYPKVVKDMYKHKNPYADVNITNKFYEWYKIGVEYLTTSELFIIMPLESCYDEKSLFLTNGELTVRATLNQYEYIYWLFSEYNISFDKEHFLEKYFKDSTPLYESFVKNKIPIPEYLLCNNE